MGKTKFAIWKIMVIVFVLGGILTVVGIVQEKLDKRTPEQKQAASRQKKLSEYSLLKRDFPSMSLDGKVVRVDVEWLPDRVRVIFPKTYGFGATRFATSEGVIGRSDIRQRSELYGDHLFLRVPAKIWSGPSESGAFYTVAIPVSLVPEHFRTQIPKPLSTSRSAESGPTVP